MSLFTAAPVPSAPSVASPVPAPDAVAPALGGDGHVLFVVDGTTFAVPVSLVREVLRAPRLLPLPAASGFPGAIALVDVRGRSVPVVDLRADPSGPGDVLLPVLRRHAGLVVDRVASVTGAGDLVPEAGEVPRTLPGYARGVVRPVTGGDPVVLVGLPDASVLADAGA